MNSFKKIFTALLIFCSSTCFAETRYISDMQYVPLRSGPGNDYRITHKGLPSGTAMTVFEVDKSSGYSRIKTQKGTEGWIRSQYLIDKPTAKTRLDELQLKIKQSTQSTQKTQAELNEAKGELESLRTEKTSLESSLNKTSSELTELKKLSGNTLDINEKNKVLLQKNHLLENEIDVLKAENQRLEDSSDRKMFLQGGGLVIIALLLGVWLSGVKKHRSYSSGWQ